MTERAPAGEPDATRPGQARNEQATAAAADSVDLERLLPGESEHADPLLPGENPSVSYRSDVEMWISVYSELLDFKRFMLDGATQRVDGMTTELARTEIQNTDLRVARAEAERFTRRLAFWRGRLDTLLAASPTT